tara:strand:+ start:1385 stop:1567 length:183 start_codon:yes stop_codon:yes gene_type:complete
MDVSEYSYFVKYKNNLTQYILYNCTTKNEKKRGRINLTESQLLSLLKELNEITLYIDRLN